MLQPTRIRDAVANCSCNARGTGFLENHPVAAALDHSASSLSLGAGGLDHLGALLDFLGEDLLKLGDCVLRAERPG